MEGEETHGHGCRERIDTRVPVSSIGRDPKVRPHTPESAGAFPSAGFATRTGAAQPRVHGGERVRMPTLPNRVACRPSCASRSSGSAAARSSLAYSSVPRLLMELIVFRW